MLEADYGRSSAAMYVAAGKAFFRFAVVRRYLPGHFSYELMREGLRQVMGKPKRRSPRIDERLPDRDAHRYPAAAAGEHAQRRPTARGGAIARCCTPCSTRGRGVLKWSA
jgi:hypothetical protein